MYLQITYQCEALQMPKISTKCALTGLEKTRYGFTKDSPYIFYGVPYSAKFWWGKFWRTLTLRIFDGNILTDGHCLSPYTCKGCIVFKQFDGLNFDGLAGKHQKHQNFPQSKFPAIWYNNFLYWQITWLYISYEQSNLYMLVTTKAFLVAITRQRWTST